MATQGKIVTLFEDKDKTQGVFPRTKVSAISNNDGVGLDVILDELKKSVSDGKSAVAGAITSKGVSTASDATFETMATNINSIKVAVASAEPVFVTSSGTTSANWLTSDVFETTESTTVYAACFKVYRSSTNENATLQGSNNNSEWTNIQSHTTETAYGLMGGWYNPVIGYKYYRIQCVQGGGAGAGCHFTFMTV